MMFFGMFLWDGHGFTSYEKTLIRAGFGKGTALAVPLRANKNAGFSSLRKNSGFGWRSASALRSPLFFEWRLEPLRSSM